MLARKEIMNFLHDNPRRLFIREIAVIIESGVFSNPLVNMGAPWKVDVKDVFGIIGDYGDFPNPTEFRMKASCLRVDEGYFFFVVHQISMKAKL